MMKRLSLLIGILVAVAFSLSSQSMTGTTMMPGANGGSSGSTDTNSMMAAPSGSMMASDMSYDTLKREGKLADPMMGSQLRMAPSTGMKVAYTSEMSAEDLAAQNPTVLFFAADWCPACQADLKDINANGSRLGKINVVVINYDKSSALKAKYGIIAQDTFVQIDKMGSKLAIWNGGGVDGILKNIVVPM